jgi:hypothetical protein
MICDLVKFFEGGLSFEYAERQSLSRLRELKVNAIEIGNKIKEEVNSGV